MYSFIKNGMVFLLTGSMTFISFRCVTPLYVLKSMELLPKRRLKRSEDMFRIKSLYVQLAANTV